MTLLKLDKPGTYELGAMVGGVIPAKDQVIEVTAPDVTIVGLDGTGMRRATSDPQGDGDWQCFLRIRSSAARCTVKNSRLDDNDVISIHCAAPDFVLDGSEITRTGAGAFFDGATAKSGLIRNSAIHTLDRMLRDTVTPTTDDTGASCAVYKNTPRDTANRHRIINSYLGDGIAQSHDYAWGEGSGVEIYQASSIEIIDSVLMDNSVTMETGSKSPIQVSDIHWLNCYIGALEVIADEKYRRGLGFRPVADSSVKGCKFFDLDHWDCVIGWASSTFAFGTNSNFVFSGNSHACTRNSKAYSYGGAGGTGYTLDAAETILYGAAAQALAMQFRAEAIALRDKILAGAGLVAAPPPPPPGKTVEERLAAIEAALAQLATDQSTDAELDAALAPLKAELADDERRVASLEPLHALHDQALNFAAFDAAMLAVPSSNKAKAVLAEVKKLLMPQRQ